MAEEVRLWQIADRDVLGECSRSRLDLEARLERGIAADVSVLDRELMVVGQQDPRESGGTIDPLCVQLAAHRAAQPNLLWLSDGLRATYGIAPACSPPAKKPDTGHIVALL